MNCSFCRALGGVPSDIGGRDPIPTLVSIYILLEHDLALDNTVAFVWLNRVNLSSKYGERMNARIRLSVCAEGCGEGYEKDDVEYMVKIIDVYIHK